MTVGALADLELEIPDDYDGSDPFGDAGAVRARHAADGKGEGRRPGRTVGALNRKTREFEQYYRDKGFRDPLEAMAQWLTADPVELQAWFIEHERTSHALGKFTAKAVPSLIDIIKEQHAVASDLAPYLHGKKPIQLQVIDERLPTLIINLGTNQLAQGQEIMARKALSAGSPLVEGSINEINDLAGDKDE